MLGYSGTNSKYVDIHDSDFFNNGAGVVPNTLDSEAFQPNANGRVRDNDIFWNNFNYFLPNSPVETVSGGLGHIGDATINYPTGVGVILFGSDGWTVQDNRIFGNFMWGAAAFSDPFNSGAVNQKNRFIDNQMGRNGTDTNRFDFFNDGSGKGTCFTGNTSSTFDVTPDAHHSQGFLYPGCPAPNKGTGSNQGDGASDFSGQVGELAGTCSATRPASRRTPGRGIRIRRSRGAPRSTPATSATARDRTQRRRSVRWPPPSRQRRSGAWAAGRAAARRRPRSSR